VPKLGVLFFGDLIDSGIHLKSEFICLKLEYILKFIASKT